MKDETRTLSVFRTQSRLAWVLPLNFIGIGDTSKLENSDQRSIFIDPTYPFIIVPKVDYDNVQ